MRPLRTREDLFQLAMGNAPTRACARILREQGATVYGGFNPVVDLPGWIIKVQSLGEKCWVIGVELDEARQCYRTIRLDDVPWQNWQGSSNGRSELLDGDQPRLYAFEKMKARIRNGTKLAPQANADAPDQEIPERIVGIGRDAADRV